MVSNKIVKIIVILISFSTSLLAISSQDLYKQLINKYGSIESFQADIKQNSYYSEIDYSNESQGKIFYDKENLHIGYFTPREEIISLIDTLVYIYQAEEDRLIITYADSSFVSLNIAYLIEKVWDNNLVQIEEQDDFYLVNVNLEDDNLLANISKIEFEISKETSLVERLQYEDYSDNKVNIKFSNILLNVRPKESFWEIESSDKTQIIDYRN